MRLRLLFWWPLVVAGAGVVAGAVAALPRSPARVDALMLGLCLAGLGVVVAELYDEGPAILQAPPRTADAPGTVRGATALLAVLVTLGVLVAPFCVVAALVADWPPNHADDARRTVNAAWYGIAATLWFCGGAVILNRVSASTKAVARAVARARPLAFPLSGPTYGAGAGVVRDPTPIRTDAGLAAFALTEDVEHMPGSDPNVSVEKLHAVGTFEVEVWTPGGPRRVEVAAEHLHFGNPVRRVLEGRAASGRPRTYTESVMPVGARVLLVGRVEPGPRGDAVRPTGAEPALLFRLDGAEEDPMVALRGLARRPWLRLALIAALAAGAGVLGGSEAGHLPPTHVPD